jgi:arylsulfatase A-like enzyme
MKLTPFLNFLPFWDRANQGSQSQVPISAPPVSSPSRPNIVFILTDDQDLHLNSLDYTPLTKKHLLDKGTFFRRHFCTVALCCPSRVSLWTGKAAHNTVWPISVHGGMYSLLILSKNVTDVFPPYGGYPKFVAQGLNENFLPVWLQEAGYNTY